MAKVQTGQNLSALLCQVLSIATHETLRACLISIIIIVENLPLRDYHKRLLLVLRRRIAPDSVGLYLSESAP